MKEYIAIYVRRSVSDKDKGNNSISIPAQIADCIKFVGEDADYKVYEEDGKSGKDIKHRPAFQQMFEDCRNGLISKIVVKKYDRFSRNLREYLNITDELDKLGVPVVSLMEPFNTDTKEGRMMRNNLLNFAEFERETIAARVADAFATKAVETGFYQGGKMYFGFRSERRTINGKTGSVLVPSESAVTVQAMFDIYKEPNASLLDCVNYIKNNNLPVTNTYFTNDVEKTKKYAMDRTEISNILKNPMYVKADRDIFRYFLNKGYTIIDDIDAFDGIHGILWHKNAEEDRYIKIAYHEGLVDSSAWLAVQDKKANNRVIPKSTGFLVSWLVGIAKCAHCRKSLRIVYGKNIDKTIIWRYYNCRGVKTVAGCDLEKERLKIKPDEVEAIVFEAMKEHIKEFDVVRNQKKSTTAEEDRIKKELLRIETDTKKLVDKLVDADEVLFAYIQEKVNELHKKKNDYETQLLQIERRVKNIDLKPIAEPLKKWDTLTMEQKRDVAVAMIDVIYISDDNGVEIHFSF